MSTTNSNNHSEFLTPLRQVCRQQVSVRPMPDFQYEQQRREMLLRTTTIAYGLAEMFRRARSHRGADAPSLSSPACERSRWSIDNFAVRSSTRDMTTWKEIKGVEMLSSPRLSMNIVEPSYLCDVEQEDQLGSYLEAEFPTLLEDADGTAAAVSQNEEDDRCHALGVILYELFLHISILTDDGHQGGNTCSFSQEPAHKRTRIFLPTAIAAEKSPTAVKELVELGVPSSISLLVQNLLECRMDVRPDDAYECLDTVSKDLHLLHNDPSRFLFNREITPDNGRVQLSFRKHTLYGRENEVSLITDAFCRVSSGRSEAFFIGGFSGSGKSRLVHSLTARVDICEGYVLTHKFDQMSKERCLLEVVAVFNDLCILIREKRTPPECLAISNNLADVFGADFSMLAQLLPNIRVLSSMSSLPLEGIRLNLQSVCFILQRFMRVVSSESHPVMVFLDDLQWCTSAALMLIEDILCDSIGSSCFFFVGSYRSNEVEHDHDIFRLIDSLSSSNVPMTKLSLEGLNPEDLNAMISDGLGIFPRISEPLSDIVFQKTKGNPFFSLSFLRSLVDEGLLEFNVRKGRWSWDEECITSMDITGNVLCLLSSKMSGLVKNTQLALKVASCFGIKMKETIVDYLNIDMEYSGIRNGMDLVVKEGFMIKVGPSEFKFVHDRIREAAYSLIPESEKKKYHYSLGMSLYLTTKGNSVDDIPLFSITDQVNHGIDSSEQSPELQLDLAKLNERSGLKAMDLSDYVTACSYLNTALTFLATDHWKNHYDQSLQLYVLLAKSAYSCGKTKKSEDVLKIVLHQARCLSDKLEAFILMAAISFDTGEVERAWTIRKDVLLQLGETIPDEFGELEMNAMRNATSEMLMGVTEESLLGMEEMESKKQSLLKLYMDLPMLAVTVKPAIVPFLHCRMVQLSMENGISKYSLLGLVQFAAIFCIDMKMEYIQEARRIGRLAMSVLKQIDSATDQIMPRVFYYYFGFVAIYSEPVQSSVDSLRRGFEYGMASGDIIAGLINASYHIGKSLVAGINLPSLLERTNYYSEVANTYNNKMAKMLILQVRDTVLLLMGKGYKEEEVGIRSGAAYHKGIRAFWGGHHERSDHFIEQIVQGKTPGYGNHKIQVMLYYGLNSLKITRTKSEGRAGRLKMKGVPRRALKTLTAAAGYSPVNFCNKVQLLKAEIFSFEERNEEAKLSYTTAIASAQCSGAIHEQGLACELAGFHYKRVRDEKNARDLFSQAKQCYENWGSQMKVDSITHQLNKFQI